MIPVTKRLVPALLIIPLALIGIAIAKDVSKLSKQPNIVLIFCDDHASPAISAYGDARKLIETLADQLAAALLAEFSLRWIEITIRKFILPNAEWVSVSIRREAV